MSKIQKINLLEKFDLFTDQWSPKVIGQVNTMQVKIAKIEGEFVWHHHEEEDELFFVIKGNLTIALPDDEVHLAEGEMVIIPHGVEHKPIAREECYIMMFEPAETLNTGNIKNEYTHENLDNI